MKFITQAKKISLLLFLSCLGINALSAERILLGHTPNSDVAKHLNLASSSVLSQLKQTSSTHGTVRVIIGVRVPFAPEGDLSTAERAQQRSEISAAQQTVLNQVPHLSQPDRNPKVFETIPFLSLEVTSDDLDKISSIHEIISIEEDRLAEPTLLQSVPLIGASSGTFNGFNGSGQAVAILDTGVDKNHVDLSGRVISEACYSTSNPSSGIQSLCADRSTASIATGSAMPYANGICPRGGCDHGTHVAGTAAGAQGVGRGASLIAIQVFSLFPPSYCGSGATAPCALSYSSDQIKGLERVRQLSGSMSVASANMSLGSGKNLSNCDSGNTALKSIIDNLRSSGVATIISSGNSGYSDGIGSPACISSAISVGASWDAAGFTNVCGGRTTSAVDSVACFSNSANILHLLAPGALINAPIPNGGYGNWTGTSMAAPHVAGAWAVLKQRAPNANVDQVLNALTSTGVPVLDTRNNITKPRINVLAAVNALGGGVQTYALSVTKSGNGTGTVNSFPGGINCGSDCTENYNANSIVTLTATPTEGHNFGGWSGACSGSSSSCVVTINAATTVIATFTQTPQATLSVAKVGSGSGIVMRSGGSINCGSTCSESLAIGSTATLTATPSAGSSFVGWRGGTCDGAGTCAFSLNANNTVTAIFNATSGGNTVNPLLITNIGGTSSSAQTFLFSVPTGARNLKIEMSGGAGDADLYVRHGAAPTTSTYDCQSISTSNNEICFFAQPTSGNYYVLIQGYSNFSGATISATYQISNDISTIINLLLLN